MSYGGIPLGELVHKLEETPPDLVAAERGGAVEDDYNTFARKAIVDRSPDTPYLDSDQPRRNAALSRIKIHQRTNGGRGTAEPKHPDLFVGFTGNDPRGRENIPLFNKARDHTYTRARGHETRMGRSVGHGDFMDTSRPWGGVSMMYDKKEMQRRTKNHMPWFSSQKEENVRVPNVVSDERYSIRQRSATASGGDEGMHTLSNGSYEQAVGREGVAPSRVDRARDSDTSPWRNTTGDTELGVARYGASTRAGRATIGASATGGARTVNTRTETDFGAHARGMAANRQVLVEGMGAAAANRRAKNRQNTGDTDYGKSIQAQAAGRSAPELTRDIARAVYQSRHDQTLRAAGQIQDHEGGRQGPGAGLLPPDDRQALLHSVEATHARAGLHLTNAEAMVKSLRNNTSAKIRMVQGQAVAAGALGTPTGEIGTNIVGGGLRPTGDPRKQAYHSLHQISRPAAAGLEVHHYGSLSHASLNNPMNAVKEGRNGGFDSARESKTTLSGGVSKGPEFLGHSTGSYAADRKFCTVGDTPSSPGGSLLPPNNDLRATSLPRGGLHAQLGEFQGGGGAMGGDQLAA